MILHIIYRGEILFCPRFLDTKLSSLNAEPTEGKYRASSPFLSHPPIDTDKHS